MEGGALDAVNFEGHLASLITPGNTQYLSKSLYKLLNGDVNSLRAREQQTVCILPKVIFWSEDLLYIPNMKWGITKPSGGSYDVTQVRQVQKFDPIKKYFTKSAV